MKLYMHPASITSRIVRLYIADKGLDVEEEVVDLFTGAHHQEPFVTINPNRLVPVLDDGDFRLTESAAILIYLAEKFDLPEYPKDVKARAKVNEAMFWASFNFYRDWGYNLGYPQLFPQHKRPTDEGHRVAVEWGRDKSTFWLQVLERPLARRWPGLADRRGDDGRRLLRRRPGRARRPDPLGLREDPEGRGLARPDQGAAALGRGQQRARRLRGVAEGPRVRHRLNYTPARKEARRLSRPARAPSPGSGRPPPPGRPLTRPPRACRCPLRGRMPGSGGEHAAHHRIVASR